MASLLFYQLVIVTAKTKFSGLSSTQGKYSAMSTYVNTRLYLDIFKNAYWQSG